MRKAKISYARVDEGWMKVQKLGHLDEVGHGEKVAWEEITPDKDNTCQLLIK